MQSKVVVISTGGTIAMRFDDRLNGFVPAVSGQELVEAIPQLKDICAIEVIDFSNIPSANMTPQHMQQIALKVEAVLTRQDVTGVVITHGTDTIEETAYFLDLYTQQEKPICLTAAMRGSGALSSDGPNNILCAIRVASDQQTRNYGVMVVMNNEIHTARDVTKTHTGNVKTFSSPFWGPIGYVDDDCVIMHRAPNKRQCLRGKSANELTATVPILKVYTGIETAWLQAMLSVPANGFIIEGFGRGNFPESIVPEIQKLIDRQIPVVLTSRVLGGRILDVYAAPGSGGDLKKRGAILPGEISSHKARLKLILALEISTDLDDLKTIMSL